MVFKTQSFSVCGFDTSIVQVEVDVDVGSARMQGFNAAGLPGNAVKEGRDRVKPCLASRQAAFEFALEMYDQPCVGNSQETDRARRDGDFQLNSVDRHTRESKNSYYAVFLPLSSSTVLLHERARSEQLLPL